LIALMPDPAAQTEQPPDEDNHLASNRLRAKG
jgi:hypothetical protein